MWYCYGATPKKPKAGIRFFICRKMQMKCFASPALAKQMQRRMDNEKTDLSLSVGTDDDNWHSAGHGACG
ncbi:MAG: hypothetical protein PUK39_02795 [Clostridiales bacterium]|nr:hypothetical protein [Clostridiales bacterium]